VAAEAEHGRDDEGVGEPVGDGVEDHVPELLHVAGQFGERGDAAATDPAEPESSASTASSSGTWKMVRGPSFNRLGAIELRVGLREPGEFGVLAFGWDLGVLPEGLAGPLDDAGQGARRSWRGVLARRSASRAWARIARLRGHHATPGS